MLNKSFIFSLILLFSVQCLTAAPDKKSSAPYTSTIQNDLELKATLIEVANIKAAIKIERENRARLIEDRRKHHEELNIHAYVNCLDVEEKNAQSLDEKGKISHSSLATGLKACDEIAENEKKVMDHLNLYNIPKQTEATTKIAQLVQDLQKHETAITTYTKSKEAAEKKESKPVNAQPQVNNTQVPAKQ